MIARQYLLLVALLIEGAHVTLAFLSEPNMKCFTLGSRPFPLQSTVSPSVDFTTTSSSTQCEPNGGTNRHSFSKSSRIPRGQEWINESIKYYTRVMHKGDEPLSSITREEQSRTAKRLYHAIQNVRSGNLNRAENIYRKTIQDIERLNSDQKCDDEELAITTLLLALVLQRMDNIGEARMVFHRFFRQAMSKAVSEPNHKCACTAKVLGAYALFEMKFGSVHRSIEVARRAAQFDNDLSKLFTWKKFRDAKRKISPRPSRKSKLSTLCSFAGEVEFPDDTENFRLRSYLFKGKSKKFAGAEPSVIYHAAKPPFGSNGTNGKANDLPLLIHDSGVMYEAFGSDSCKCKDRLELSMEYIKEHGGIVVYFRPEGQSTGIAQKVAASVTRNHGSHGIQFNAYTEYDAVVSILHDMRVESIRIVSNNNQTKLRRLREQSLVRRLRELGVNVRGTVPLGHTTTRSKRSLAVKNRSKSKNVSRKGRRDMRSSQNSLRKKAFDNSLQASW